MRWDPKPKWVKPEHSRDVRKLVTALNGTTTALLMERKNNKRRSEVLKGQSSKGRLRYTFGPYSASTEHV